VNKEWIALHLAEAQEELERTLRELQRPDYSEVEFQVAMAHAYNHLNTAWNSRNRSPERVAKQTDEEFYRWRAFPTDIDMGRP
jgi:hypothetical protein